MSDDNVFADASEREAMVAAMISRGMMTVLVDGIRTAKILYPQANVRVIALCAAALISKSVDLGNTVYEAATN